MLDERAFKIIKLMNLINRVSETRIEKAEMIAANIEKFSELSGLSKEETLKKIVELEWLIYTGEQKKSQFKMLIHRIFRWQ